jgi:hypothetical protein
MFVMLMFYKIYLVIILMKNFLISAQASHYPDSLALLKRSTSLISNCRKISMLLMPSILSISRSYHMDHIVSILISILCH